MNITDIFGTMTFSDDAMKDIMSGEDYLQFRNSVNEGTALTPEIAKAVAEAMRQWAIGKGATHFTHWFQPLTGITAEKHDSFLSVDKNGKAITEFSWKELIKGEPDASSFPSGGLRATFEARGYTSWDPTSYAFIKDNTLCIPTAFCAFGGQALDKKTPLLKSVEAINTQALRILRIFGDSETTRVIPTAGAEQEYFLIDKDLLKKRRDLFYTGRTLFGAKAPRSQEMSGHYFGAIKPRVAAFMKDLDVELWKLGVFAKTEHNETAPSQHELAPIYTDVNTATDNNQLTMEIMKNVADKHGLVCLLHEKPFAGVNGSGKHNNWSLQTDKGLNLFDPGKNPHENAQFLLFVSAVLQAVDDYQDLLRISVASAGNDLRLGGNEAPPAIVSIFLGDELTEILEDVEKGVYYVGKDKTEMETGVSVIPRFTKDSTDRNRTSPFAFTGNKFEFRMVGSSMSIAGPNTILNTVVAESLSQFADRIEKSFDFRAEINQIIRETVQKHRRIIFNGNGYGSDWIEEAERRGLLNLRNTPAAIPHFSDDKNIELFKKHNIFTEEEIRSRAEIMYRNYINIIHSEAATMVGMAKRDILPAIMSYEKQLADSIIAKSSVLDLENKYEKEALSRLSVCADDIMTNAIALEDKISLAEKESDIEKAARIYGDEVCEMMLQLRESADSAEVLLGRSCLPYPSYGELLFSI